MATPVQYAVKQPIQDLGNLSPLQLALAYYMDLGQQVPFSVNTDFIAALKTYSDSGVVLPSDLNLDAAAVVVDGPFVKIIRRAENCGPNEISRYDSIVVGSKADLLPNAWTFDTSAVRGGSISNGGGGPWGNGGVESPFPGPNNAVDKPVFASVFYDTNATNYDGRIGQPDPGPSPGGGNPFGGDNGPGYTGEA